MPVLSSPGPSVAVRPGRCAAAAPQDPAPCSGAADEVRVRETGGTATNGCALHAAALLTLLPQGRLEAGSRAGAVFEAYRLARPTYGARSFEFLRTHPWR